MTSKTVFSTAWFDVVAKQNGERRPRIMRSACLDYVATVAVTPEQEFVLVRQERPAIERRTLELPAGHVEAGEAALDSARRELEEETGFHVQPRRIAGQAGPRHGAAIEHVVVFSRTRRRADAARRDRPSQGSKPCFARRPICVKRSAAANSIMPCISRRSTWRSSPASFRRGPLPVT